MTICYGIDGRYIQDHFPGIGRYTFNLIDALGRVAPDEKWGVLYNPALKNTRYDIASLAHHANVELRATSIPTFSLREQLQLPREASNFQLFHSPYYIKPYWLRVPSIVTLFDLIPLRVPSAVSGWRARWLFRALVSLAIRTSVRVIVPSVATRDDLIELLHVPREKIVVIPLAADARFAPQSENGITHVRKKYALPNEYVLYVGSNKPHKNLKTLIEAWRSIQEHKAWLIIAGAWDTRYDVPDAKARHVQFIHDVDDADLPALYSGASVFVSPSLYEGFGLTPLEAMACGAPVVCANVSSLPEVVGDAALWVNPHTPDEIAATLRQVLNDASLRETLRAKSLARAAQFSWERTARETLAVYRTALNTEY
jgi:glycosyltransferase involved in cell wall biosynthesis